LPSLLYAFSEQGVPSKSPRGRRDETPVENVSFVRPRNPRVDRRKVSDGDDTKTVPEDLQEKIPSRNKKNCSRGLSVKSSALKTKFAVNYFSVVRVSYFILRGSPKFISSLEQFLDSKMYEQYFVFATENNVAQRFGVLTGKINIRNLR